MNNKVTPHKRVSVILFDVPCFSGDELIGLREKAFLIKEFICRNNLECNIYGNFYQPDRLKIAEKLYPNAKFSEGSILERFSDLTNKINCEINIAYTINSVFKEHLLGGRGDNNKIIVISAYPDEDKNIMFYDQLLPNGYIYCKNSINNDIGYDKSFIILDAIHEDLFNRYYCFLTGLNSKVLSAALANECWPLYFPFSQIELFLYNIRSKLDKIISKIENLLNSFLLKSPKKKIDTFFDILHQFLTRRLKQGELDMVFNQNSYKYKLANNIYKNKSLELLIIFKYFIIKSNLRSKIRFIDCKDFFRSDE